jgi:hypothetical protein
MRKELKFSSHYRSSIRIGKYAISYVKTDQFSAEEICDILRLLNFSKNYE